MIKRTWDYISCVLFSAIIGITVNYLIYVFQVPLIYSVLPLLPSILLTELKIKKKRRAVKYICLLSQVIISFFFISFMYYEPKSLLLTSIPLSLVLLFWCVLCIEQKIKLDKKTLIYIIVFILVLIICYVFIWGCYTQRAVEATKYIIDENSPQLIIAAEIDGLCNEIDVVFYSSNNVYKFTDFVHNCIYGEKYYQEEFIKFQNRLKSADRIGIKLLMDSISSLKNN